MAAAASPPQSPRLLPHGPAAAAPAAAAGAAPIPAATLADVQAAISQLPPESGSIGVSAEKVDPRPKIMVAEVDKKKSELVWHLERKVEWKGEKYKLKINFPLKKSEKEMSDQEKQDFKHAAKQFADLFVQDLLTELGNLKSSEAEVIRIFFDEDNGYTISTDDKYNPQDPKTAEGKDVVFAKSDASKALSKAITNDDRTPAVMRKLLEAPALASLRETAEKQNAEKSKTLPPAGLKWNRNGCFIHSPFQQLATEPTIAGDLANPAYYKNGEENLLFRAVKKYRECQATGESFDAALILREELDDSGEFRDALEYGWQAFGGFFDFDNIPESSHLHSLFTNPVSIQVGRENDAPDLSTLAEMALGPNDPPAVFSLQVQDRLAEAEETEQPLLSGKVSKEERLAFLTDVTNAIAEQPQLTDEEMIQLQFQLPPNDELTSDYLDVLLGQCKTPENKKKLCARIAFDAIKAVFVAKDGNGNDPLERLTHALLNDESEDTSEIAAALLDNEATLQAVFELLTADQKKTINAHRTKRLEYNDTLVKIADTGQLMIKGKTYDIASFTCHTPTRNHFIAYVQKDGKYYELDDLSTTKKVKEIDLKDFVTAAGKAYFYTIRDESLTPKAVSADAVQSQKPVEPVVKPNIVKEEIRVDGSSSTALTIEEGSMKGAGKEFALAHPSTTGFQRLHPQLEDVIARDKFGTTIRTAKASDERWYDRVTKPYEARGTGRLAAFHEHWYWPTPGARLLLTQSPQPIIHAPLPSLTTKEDIQQAVSDILKFALANKIENVAFPVFECTETLESTTVLTFMKEAIEQFVKETPEWVGGHIKIIQPRPQEAAGAA